MLAFALTLALVCSPPQDPQPGPAPGEVAARFAVALSGDAPTEARSTATLRAQLAAWPELPALLLATLEDWRLPAREPGEEGARLERPWREFLLGLVAELPAEAFRDARAKGTQATRAGELRAGLRLEGALTRGGSLRGLLALARRTSELGLDAEVEPAFEEAVALALARDPKGLDALRPAWEQLSSELAGAALRALLERPSAAGAECVRTWLGRRAELDAAVLLALGALHASVDEARRESLAGKVQSFLSSPEVEVVQAAATALGRLGTPDSVPWLIELFVHEDPAVQRAALGALRTLGGVNLPGSAVAWRSWYAREETWYQEESVRVLEELELALASEDPVAPTRAVLRTLSEHRLHRDELVEQVRPLLEHERPRLRILACQALERMGSRRALPWLVACLLDPEESVVSAAHAALCTLERVRLGNEPAVWCERLGLPLPGSG